MCTNNTQSSDSSSYFKTNSNATYYTTIKFVGFIWGWFSEISYFFILTVNVSHLPHMTLMSTSSALHVHSLSCPAHQLCKLLHVLIFSLFFHSCFCYGGGGQVSKFEFKFLASGLCKNGYIHCSPEVQKQPLKNASTSQITQGWYFLWQGSVSTSFRPSKEFFSLS